MAGASISSIGLTGLLSYQQAIATTGHNISNSGTEGYSRQRVEFSSNDAEFNGLGFSGRGVQVADISRVFDSFTVQQIRSYTSSSEQFAFYSRLAQQVDPILSDSENNINAHLQRFFDSLSALAAEPASIPLRNQVMSEGRALTERFNDVTQRLNDIRSDLNQQTESLVRDINGITKQISDANLSVVEGISIGGNREPNDIIDQRDRLLKDLSSLVDIQVVELDDGMVNVFLSNGSPLVVAGENKSLGTELSALDTRNLDVVLTNLGGNTVITERINGGQLGGLLRFREEVLDTAAHQVGLIAQGVAQTFNATHRFGMDVNGSLGTDLFVAPSVEVIAASDNTGGLGASASISDVSQLIASSYQLFYDGTDFQITRLSDGTTTNLGAGPAPFNVTVDGLDISITASTPVQAGDRMTLSATRNAGAEIALAFSNSARLATAAPTRTQAVTSNVGEAVISASEIIDPTDANLLDTMRIQFNDPATTYDLIDVGTGTTVAAGVAYVDGQDITVNGSRFQISGQPVAGDQFLLEPNLTSVGDGRNALRLFDIKNQTPMLNGTTSLQQAYTIGVSDVGIQARQAAIGEAAQTALLDQAVRTRESLSGVNLDEEAANLLRYQQLYSAMAQVISVADSLFNTVLGIVNS